MIISEVNTEGEEAKAKVVPSMGWTRLLIGST